MPRTTPLVIKGRFVNPGFAGTAAPGPLPEEGAAGEMAEVAQPGGFRQFLKWQREHRKARRNEPKTIDVPRVDEPPEKIAPAQERGIALTWVGHSTVLLQLDGKNYLTDPVWSNRIGGVVPRKTAPGIPMSALPRIDAVLQSHNHYDHLDARTIAKLPRATPIHCTTGVGAWFRKRKFRDVTERSWWESSTTDGHDITCVPAQHFSGRTLFDRDRTLWGGWVVRGPHSSAYFAGDSGYCAAFKEVGEAFPRLDVALMPIGAYAPRWFMGPVHVDPAEAGQAFLDCGARTMLPTHWGTFRLADEAVDEPPRVMRKWWSGNGLAAERLLLPRMGETVRVAPERERASGPTRHE